MTSPTQLSAPPLEADAEGSLTVAHVDLGAVRHNLGVIRRRAEGAAIIGIVKADAYGHGALRVAETLRSEGVTHFAVATVAEGVALRRGGIDGDILVFAAPLPHQIPAYAEHDLAVTASSMETADVIVRSGLPLRVHVKVDTGMHRIGVRAEDTRAVLDVLRRGDAVEVVGIWTHFATSDSVSGADAAFVQQQMRQFQTAIDAAAEIGFDECPIHLANSGALWFVPDSVRERAFVRAGGLLYGLPSSAGLAEHATEVRPAMRLTTRVVHRQLVPRGDTVSYGRTWKAERPTYVATLPIGYADGLPRTLSNQGLVGIDGHLFPVAGRVCMDMTMVDLGAVGDAGEQVRVGDEVVVFGAGGPSAFEQANRSGLMAYVMTTGLTARVPRRYTNEPDS